MKDQEKFANLVEYFTDRRDHAKIHGAAVIETLDLDELEAIVDALTAIQEGRTF